MNKKFLMPIIGCSLISICITVISLNNSEIMSNADGETFKIKMSSSNNKFDTTKEESIITSELGGKVTFKHSEIVNSDSSWHVLENNGYFYNVDPIHGLQSISININNENASYKIYYNGGGEFLNYKEATSSITFDFNEEYPNYFKIENTSGSDLDIESIDLIYTCTNHYSLLTIESVDSTMGTVSGDSGYILNGSEVTVIATANIGYDFTGWYENETLKSEYASYTFNMETNLSLVAQFDNAKYNLTVESIDESQGYVSSSSGEYYYGEEITITAYNNEGYFFYGWVVNDEILTSQNPYTLTMPNSDYTIKAKFFDEENKEGYISHGVIPVVNETEGTVTYGLYPQTNVNNDETLITELDKLAATTQPDSNGYYLYNNEYYKKITATTSSKDHYFSNNVPITNGNEYWFICEPILWIILANSNNEYFLFSDMILDREKYQSVFDPDNPAGANNYAKSDIRSYLNNEFYNASFSLNALNVITTEIDNSAASTDNIEENENACENTFDKVSTMSYQDLLKEEYGFINTTGESVVRKSLTTDYARAINVNTNSEYYGYYWTRSPYSTDSLAAWFILHEGEYYCHFVDRTVVGIRPCITLRV